MFSEVAPGLHALLERVIDYAGMFPPAAVSPEAAVVNFERYRASPHAWMLRWLVVCAAELERVPQSLDVSLSVLSDTEQPRAAAVEAKRVVALGRPTYCEVPLPVLDEVRRTSSYAKIRTGGVTPEAIPPVEDVAKFIRKCADLRLPFKATAGLHHPIRAMHPLTYEPDAPRAVMHGFLNVFIAAAFAWHGECDIEPILAETDAAAFRFDERVHWRDRSLDANQVREARLNFIHSFGSCSFEEPVRDLQALGLL